MDAFQLPDLDRQRVEASKLYLEFLRTPALSLGLYVLPAGGVDAQQPHKEEEEEVYYVVKGRVIGDNYFCRPARVVDVDQSSYGSRGRRGPSGAGGSVELAPPGVPHRFHSITEELRILVFFAPA